MAILTVCRRTSSPLPVLSNTRSMVSLPVLSLTYCLVELPLPWFCRLLVIVYCSDSGLKCTSILSPEPSI